MRPQIVKIFTCVLCLCASTSLFAAPQQGTSEPPPPTMERTVELPIDSNIYFLVAVALIFGIYVAYRRHVATRASR